MRLKSMVIEASEHQGLGQKVFPHGKENTAEVGDGCLAISEG